MHAGLTHESAEDHFHSSRAPVNQAGPINNVARGKQHDN